MVYTEKYGSNLGDAGMISKIFLVGWNALLQHKILALKISSGIYKVVEQKIDREAPNVKNSSLVCC